jgi:hypothetical protein
MTYKEEEAWKGTNMTAQKWFGILEGENQDSDDEDEDTHMKDGAESDQDQLIEETLKKGEAKQANILSRQARPKMNRLNTENAIHEANEEL